MLYLVLAVLASSAVSIVMRLSEGRAKNNFAMFMSNYLVCSLIAAEFTLFTSAPSSEDGAGFALMLGAIAGGMYLTTLLLMQLNIKKNGVTLSSVFMKLGVIVPLLIATLVFRERPSLFQYIGLIIAGAAIGIIYFEPGEKSGGEKRTLLLLLALLIGGGMTESFAHLFERLGSAEYKNHYIFFTFFSAFLLSALVTAIKKEKISKYDLFYGAMIGVPNYFATRCLLLSLHSVPAVAAYPVYNIGAIIIIGLAGVFFFKEKVRGRRLIGYFMIVAALLLLNI